MKKILLDVLLSSDRKRFPLGYSDIGVTLNTYMYLRVEDVADEL